MWRIFSFLLLISYHFDRNEAACPTNFTSFAGKCLKLSDKTFASYALARADCVANNSLPASLSDHDLFYFVSTLVYLSRLPTTTHTYIGLLQDTNGFSWEDGTPYSWAIWRYPPDAAKPNTAISNHDFLIRSHSGEGYVACQHNTKDTDPCQVRWAYSDGGKIHVVPTSALTDVTITECLAACKDSCKVASYERASKKCELQDNREGPSYPYSIMNGWQMLSKYCTNCTTYIPASSMVVTEAASPAPGNIAKLYNQYNATSLGYWKSASRKYHHLTLSYNNLTEVRGLSVQNSGAWSLANNKFYATVKYYLAYSVDGINFKYVLSGPSDKRAKEVPGTYAYETPHTYILEEPIYARHLKFIPLTSSQDTHFGNRFGIRGCASNKTAAELKDEILDLALGMQDGYIQDYQITSDVLSATNPPWAARLGQVQVDNILPYWTAPDITKEPYIDIHLYVEHYISGVSLAATKYNEFLPAYKINTSPDCVTYSFMNYGQGPPNGADGIFLQQIYRKARCIRITPDTNTAKLATGATLALTMEIYGSPYVYNTISSDHIKFVNSDATCSCGNPHAVCGGSPNTTFEINFEVNNYVLLHHVTEVKLSKPADNLKVLVYAKAMEDWDFIMEHNFNATGLGNMTFKRAVKAKSLKIVVANSPSDFCSPLVIKGEKADRCPANFLSYRNKCYKVLSGDVKYTEDMCSKYTWTSRGRNARIKEALELYFLYEILNDPTAKFWLDLTLNTSSNEWTWSDGSKLKFERWAEGFPTTNANENCTIQIDDRWQNVACDTLATRICEIDQNRDPDVGRCEWIKEAKYFDVAETNFVLLPEKTVYDCVYRCQQKTDCYSANFMNDECKLYTNPDIANSKDSILAKQFRLHCSDCDRSLIWGEKGVGAKAIATSKNVNSALPPAGPEYAWIGNKKNTTQSGAWRSPGNGEYIMVDLGKPYNVSRLILQGCSDLANDWPAHSYLYISNNSIHWTTTHLSGEYPEILYTYHASMLFDFEVKLYARFVRLDPYLFKTSFRCLRFDLYGCELPSQPNITGCAVYMRTSAFATERRMLFNGREMGHATSTAGLSVARVHRQTCKYEFDIFNIQSDVAEVDRLISFIKNTTEDHILVGCNVLTVNAHWSLLNETFFNLGIPDFKAANPLFIFKARPGHPNESDYTIANDRFTELYTIVSPFTRSYNRDLNYSRIGLENDEEIATSQFQSIEYGQPLANYFPFQATLFSRPFETVKMAAYLRNYLNFVVKLGIPHNLTGVIAQGGAQYYARRYDIDTSMTIDWPKEYTRVYTVRNARDALGIRFKPRSAVYVQVWPTVPHGHRFFRFDLLGFPLDMPVVELNITYAEATASSSGSCTALDAVVNLTKANCPNFCLDPDASGQAWWEVDTAALYEITHIHLLGEGLQNLTYDIKLYSVKKDEDPWQDAEEKMSLSWNTSFVGWKMKFAPVLRAKKIRLVFLNGESVCFKMVFHGRRADFCPPLSTLDPERRICYYGYNKQVKVTYSVAESVCSRFKYISKGHLPLLENANDVKMVRYQAHTFQPYSWIGLARADGVWKWANGTVVTNTSHIPVTRAGHNWDTATSDCGIILNTFTTQPSGCTNAYGLICHTPAAMYKMDIVKQQVAMNKDITTRKCDIWQWDSIGIFKKRDAGRKFRGYLPVAACEDLCEWNSTCNGVMLNYIGHHYTTQCYHYLQPLREDLGDRHNIRYPKFHSVA